MEGSNEWPAVTYKTWRGLRQLVNEDIYPSPVFVSTKYKDARTDDIPTWFVNYLKQLNPEHTRPWDISLDALSLVPPFPKHPGRSIVTTIEDTDLGLRPPANAVSVLGAWRIENEC